MCPLLEVRRKPSLLLMLREQIIRPLEVFSHVLSCASRRRAGGGERSCNW